MSFYNYYCDQSNQSIDRNGTKNVRPTIVWTPGNWDPMHKVTCEKAKVKQNEETDSRMIAKK